MYVAVLYFVLRAVVTKRGHQLILFFCAGLSEGSGDSFNWKTPKLGFCFLDGVNAGDVIGKESNDFA